MYDKITVLNTLLALQSNNYLNYFLRALFGRDRESYLNLLNIHIMGVYKCHDETIRITVIIINTQTHTTYLYLYMSIF